jgi:hypothetical protein
METQLFDWKNWDSWDFAVNVYYDCTLKVPIGPYAAGTKIDTISVDFEQGFVELYGRGLGLSDSGDDSVVLGTWNLNLSIGAKR